MNFVVILRKVIEEDPVLIRVLIRGWSTIRLLTNIVLTSLMDVPNKNVLRICKCFFKGWCVELHCHTVYSSEYLPILNASVSVISICNKDRRLEMSVFLTKFEIVPNKSVTALMFTRTSAFPCRDNERMALTSECL